MGGKTATSTQGVSIPPAVLAQYQTVNARANQTASTPFQQYGGEFVAPVNDQQNTGISGVNTAANQAQPGYATAQQGLAAGQKATEPVNAAAEAGTAASAAPLTGSQIDQYLSPYLGTVLGSTEQLINQQNQQAQAGQLGTAISSGAFGGDRTGLAAANLAQQQELAAGNIYSGIANQGYQSALSTAQGQQQIGLAGAQQLANIGQTAYGEAANTASEGAGLAAGAQSAALQGAQAQIGAGTLQQQTQQAQDTAQYNQFLQQQSYPFQVDQFLANIAEGTGALSGSTTTTQQPGGFFSDKRLKHDIKKVGETFDGQPIYSYKMHGDPRTHIGLIAQDVEKMHPRAVGLAAGYKTVDYGEATDKAAKRGHFAEGGLAGRKAYAVGGGPSIVDPSELSAILQAQQQMYAPRAAAVGAYGGSTASGPYGGVGHVPPPTGATPHLVTAQGGLNAQPSPMQNAKNVAELAKTGTQLYDRWSAKKPPAKIDAPAPAATPGDTAPVQQTTTTTSPGGLAGNGPDLSDTMPAARGGGFAQGGMPYSNPDNEMNIPDVTPDAKLSTAPALPQQQSGLSQLSGVAKDIGSIAGLATLFNRGGRAGFADGGAPDDSDPQWGDDVYNPQGVGKGVINRDPKGPDLLYTRDAGSLIPYAAPPESGLAASVSEPSNTWGIKDQRWTDSPAPKPKSNYVAPNKDTWNIGGPSSGGLFPTAAAATVNSSDLPPPLPIGTPDSSGLAASPNTSAPAAAAPTQDQKPSWWSKVRGDLAKPENLVPLLTAIGAMGTAPTRSLGVALASGLSAGAQSYYPTQQAAANVPQTQAETGLIGAHTGNVQQRTMQEFQNQFALQGFALTPDPAGKITAPDGRKYSAVPKASLLKNGDQPQTPTYNYLGKNGLQTAQGEGVRYSVAPEDAKGTSSKQIDDVYQEGNTAQQNMIKIQRWEQAMAANHGLLSPGALNEMRTDAANMWNTAMEKYGHPEYKIDGLADAQIAQKTSKGMAALGEASNQQRSFNALKAFLEQTPNPEMQREAALPLIADLHTENQMAIDKKNYIDEFDKENQRAFGAPIPRNYLATDALQAFDKDYPANSYQGERNHLATIIQSGGFAKLSSDLQNAPQEKKEKLYKALDKEFGPNFHRYFTGS